MSWNNKEEILTILVKLICK